MWLLHSLLARPPYVVLFDLKPLIEDGSFCRYICTVCMHEKEPQELPEHFRACKISNFKLWTCMAFSEPFLQISRNCNYMQLIVTLSSSPCLALWLGSKIQQKKRRTCRMGYRAHGSNRLISIQSNTTALNMQSLVEWKPVSMKICAECTI